MKKIEIAYEILSESRRNLNNYAVTKSNFDLIQAHMYSIFECYAHGVINWRTVEKKFQRSLKEYVNLYKDNKEQMLQESARMLDEYTRVLEEYKPALDEYKRVHEQKMTSNIVVKQQISESVAQQQSNFYFNKRSLKEADLKDITRLKTWNRVLENYPNLTAKDEQRVRMLTIFEGPTVDTTQLITTVVTEYGKKKKKKADEAAPATSMRPMPRRAGAGNEINIGSVSKSGGTRGIDPRVNYSPADAATLTGQPNTAPAGTPRAPVSSPRPQQRPADLARRAGINRAVRTAMGESAAENYIIANAKSRMADLEPEAREAFLAQLEKSYPGIRQKIGEAEDQMSLDLPDGSGKPPRETDKEDRYRSQQIQKKFASDLEKAEAFKTGQRVRINVRGVTPFMKKDKHGDWSPTKIYPQGGFLTGTVVKPGTLGDVVVKLDKPISYRETVRGKRVTQRLDQTEFRHWRLTPINNETNEGYKVLPNIDKDRYGERDGLEGPFRTLSGKVVYYDPKEGAYYDPDTDMYLSYDEFQQYDNDYSGMKDERDIDVKEEMSDAEVDAFHRALDAIVHKHIGHGSHEKKKDMKENKIIATGLLHDKPFRKTFKNVEAMRAWADREDADVRGYHAAPGKGEDTQESMVEAVTLDYSRYIRSHGKKPKDTGGATWMFTTAEYGSPEEDEIFNFQGSFADAKKAAAQWARSRGANRVYAMEDAVAEREMTKGEKSKEERLKKKYDDSEMKRSMKDQYGDRWEEVYYATIRKKAMEQFNEMTSAGAIAAVAQPMGKMQRRNKVKEDQMMTEAEFDESAGEKDACYHKVKSRYKVWPSAYASGALVQCRKVGAANWGNKSKK